MLGKEGLEMVRHFFIEDEDHSGARKESLYRSLDQWAEAHFDNKTPIGTTMNAYVLRVFQCLEDRMTPGAFLGPTGLRHIELLRQYLNRAFQDERMAALWLKHFPDTYADDGRRLCFAVVFLLMMLDENQPKIMPVTKLEEGPLYLLVRCGYKYMWFSDELNNLGITEAINIATMETAVRHGFYRQEEQKEWFKTAMRQYIDCCVHKHLISLLARGDNALREIVCEQFVILLLHIGRHAETMTGWGIAQLALAIPPTYMRCCERKWEWVLQEARKY